MVSALFHVFPHAAGRPSGIYGGGAAQGGEAIDGRLAKLNSGTSA